MGLLGGGPKITTPDVKLDKATQGLVDQQAQMSERDPNVITQDALRGVEDSRGLLETDTLKQKADAFGGYNPDSIYEALNKRSQDKFTDQMTAMKAKQNMQSMGQSFENKLEAQNNRRKDQMMKMDNWHRKKQIESARKQARAAAIGGIFALGGTAAGAAFGGPAGAQIGSGAGSMVGGQVASSTEK